MKLIIFLLILALGFSVVHHYHLSYFTPSTIQSFLLSFGWWAPFLYIVLYTIRPLFLFPAVLLTVSGGMTFGPWKGTMLDLIGASLGAYLAFGLARGMGKDAVQKRMGRKLHILDAGAQNHGFRTILFLRLIPLLPFDMINYGAGLSKIRFRDYALATPVGMIPAAFAYNLLGSSLRHIFSSTFFFAVGLVLILTVMPHLYKWIQNQFGANVG